MSLNLVPSCFTLANLVFGILSLYHTYGQSYQVSAVMILAAVIMDTLDGRIARRLDVSSAFGKELDSLADLVSFGVAPGLLAYAHVLEPFQWFGLSVMIWFIVAGALRLARFNVQNITGYFSGLPITAAGGLMALINLAGIFPPAFFLVSAVVLGLLMISTIRVPKF